MQSKLFFLACYREVFWNFAFTDSGITYISPVVAFVDTRTMCIFIIDVKITFKSYAGAFANAKLDKNIYYQPLITKLRQDGFQRLLVCSRRLWRLRRP